MYKLKKLDRPSSGAGAPTVGSRFAYLAAVEDLISFPDTDANNVLLQGQPVFKENTGLIPVYITTSSREYSYESQGEEDARSHKVKFIGSHPGTELEALEFAQNNLDKDFIIFIPGCQSSDPIRVLGRPCAPLKFKSSHKSGKDGSKFDFTFEQEVGSKYIYFMYNGPLQTAEMMYAQLDFTTAVTALNEVQWVKNTAATQPLVITSLNDITAKQVTFLGQESDTAKAGTISEDTTAPIMVLLKGGVQWKSLDGSSITFGVFQTGAGIALIERWRA